MSLLPLDNRNIIDTGLSILTGGQSNRNGGFDLNLATEALAPSPAPTNLAGTLVASAVRLAGTPSDQDLTAPASIRNATLNLIFGGKPPAGIDPLIFDYDQVSRNSNLLNGNLGIVRPDPDAPGAANAFPGMEPLGAFVALDSELSTVNNLYRDARNGMTDEQFRLGMIANETAGKAAKLLLPTASSRELEAVSEFISYEAAGQNWAFRSLVGVMGAHEDFRAGGIDAARNYALLLGINHAALGETAAGFPGINVEGSSAVERGAKLMDELVSYLGANGRNGGTVQNHIRNFLQQEFGLSAEDAQKFVENFAANAARTTRDVANDVVSRHRPAN